MCECYKIGGPFIAEDPDCPEHGIEARQRSRQIEEYVEENQMKMVNKDEPISILGIEIPYKGINEDHDWISIWEKKFPNGMTITAEHHLLDPVKESWWRLTVYYNFVRIEESQKDEDFDLIQKWLKNRIEWVVRDYESKFNAAKEIQNLLGNGE